MRKIYRIKQVSASILVYIGTGFKRIEFKGGNFASDGHGMFSTADLSLQNAIESLPEFGTVHTGQIYLYEMINKQGIAVCEVEEEIEKEKTEQIGFKEVKSLLIEKGVSPDELKNFKQVQKKAKEYGIEL